MPVAPSTGIQGDAYKVTIWTGETGIGLPTNVGRYPDMTIQATGTGTVTIEGTNNGTIWRALNDVGGVAVSMDASVGAMAVLREAPVKIRPVVTGGTATVILLAHGAR